MKIQINNILALELINLNYLHDIFDSFDVGIIKYLRVKKPPSHIDQTKDFILDSQRRNEKNTDYIWAILKGSEFIGCCAIRDIQTKKGDFGYWIKKEEQAKGYGKLVVNKAFKWCFENLDLEYIKYAVDKNNIPSIKIIEREGGVVFDKYTLGEDNCLDILEYRVFNN